MCGRCVQSVAEVVKEGRATPAKAGLDVGVRKTLTVKEVAGSNPYGMRRPTRQGRICGFEVVDTDRSGAQEPRHLVAGNETPLGSMPARRRVVYCYWLILGHLQALGA